MTYRPPPRVLPLLRFSGQVIAKARGTSPRAPLTNSFRSISPGVPTAALRRGLLRHARHSLLLQGVSARRLTCGFARAGKTKAQGVKAECQKGGEIQLTGL